MLINHEGSRCSTQRRREKKLLLVKPFNSGSNIHATILKVHFFSIFWRNIEGWSKKRRMWIRDKGGRVLGRLEALSFIKLSKKQ